ncbi:carbohydrate ABC transporter membrane protein 1 (CUT1 family) [Curtobacterium sp. PhB137]|uniref:carbohydrate ABC transporter permease n=1 Tax=unclassified Curtobacterium TaxID=257496 RepID=UPI000F4DF7A8|nr:MULTISPECIES: sugar ABC transporter permease [unclassified Curtobacterium]MBF4585377.1 sugar ABC transporter permease [Curtobacterium sp. VKM Ac-2887]RPE80267.1 carbohydrate ABC transporter membrane protein 1 (CUT1 family) [Curtobacterium sp. PhB137]
MTTISNRRTGAGRPTVGRGAGRPGRQGRSGPSRGSLTHPPRAGAVLVTPAIVFVAVFVLAPLVFALYISFTNWPLIGPYRFIGLQNYLTLFQDPTFVHAIGYTLLYTAIVTVPILVLGYFLAVLIRARRRGSTLLRTVFFLPYVVGLTTLSFMLVLEAQPNSGAVNMVLRWLGITDGSTAWLVNGPLATLLICVLVVWAVSGLTMVLLMSAMQGIPDEVYESAQLEGASWWQTERLITLPMIRSTIALSAIISVIGSLLAFNQFYILTQGGPGTETTTIVNAIYNRGFVNLQLGAATAESIALVVVIAAVTVFQFWALREKD